MVAGRVRQNVIRRNRTWWSALNMWYSGRCTRPIRAKTVSRSASTELGAVLAAVPKRRPVYVAGDLNGWIGGPASRLAAGYRGETRGEFGGRTNRRGVELLHMLDEHRFVVADTYYSFLDRSTFYSHSARSESELDYCVTRPRDLEYIEKCASVRTTSATTT